LEAVNIFAICDKRGEHRMMDRVRTDERPVRGFAASLPRGRLASLIVVAAVACGRPDPRPDRIFVSQAGSSTVAVIEASSGATQRIEVGMLPHGFALSSDGATLYVALVGSQAVAEIDTATARVRRTMLTAPVPDKREDGSLIQAHVEQAAFSHTTCYDCHRPDRAQPKFAGDRPFGLLLSRDGSRLFVSHLRSSVVAVLDLASGRIERSVQLAPAGAATEAVALARLGDEIWVALRARQPSMVPGALRRLDAVTLESRGDVATGSDAGALLALGERESVLVSNFESNTVTEHAGSGSAVVHTTSPGPLGLVDLRRGKALAIDYYSNAVSFLDLKAGTSETLALRHGGIPYANPTNGALASDGRSAWIVASGTDGHLLQLDLASRSIVRDLPIDGLSFGVVVVPGVAR
jgi:DNA-binding beta-propeller fold protein YncE